VDLAVKDYEEAMKLGLDGDSELQQRLKDCQKLAKRSKCRKFYELFDIAPPAYGVKVTLDLKTLKRAYRRKALQYHPDKHRTDKDKHKAALKFMEVTRAFDVLSCPEKIARCNDPNDAEDPDKYRSSDAGPGFENPKPEEEAAEEQKKDHSKAKEQKAESGQDDEEAMEARHNAQMREALEEERQEIEAMPDGLEKEELWAAFLEKDKALKAKEEAVHKRRKKAAQRSETMHFVMKFSSSPPAVHELLSAEPAHPAWTEATMMISAEAEEQMIGTGRFKAHGQHGDVVFSELDREVVLPMAGKLRVTVVNASVETPAKAAADHQFPELFFTGWDLMKGTLDSCQGENEDGLLGMDEFGREDGCRMILHAAGTGYGSANEMRPNMSAVAVHAALWLRRHMRDEGPVFLIEKVLLWWGRPIGGVSDDEDGQRGTCLQIDRRALQ